MNHVDLIVAIRMLWPQLSEDQRAELVGTVDELRARSEVCHRQIPLFKDPAIAFFAEKLGPRTHIDGLPDL